MALIDNQVSYYKFDGDATDSHGANDATINGAILTTGKINQGYNFDKVNDYLDCNDPLINWGGQYTVNFWFKLDTTSSVTYIAGGSNNGGSTGMFIRWNFGKWQFVKVGVVSLDYTWGGVDTNWHMLTCVQNGSGMDIYLDGVSVVSNTNTSGTVNPSLDYFIGARNNGGAPANFWGGDLDEYGIWDTGLNSTEVLELYNSGSGLQYPYSPAGWTGKISGVTNPSKINGLEVANINTVNGQ